MSVSHPTEEHRHETHGHQSMSSEHAVERKKEEEKERLSEKTGITYM